MNCGFMESGYNGYRSTPSFSISDYVTAGEVLSPQRAHLQNTTGRCMMKKMR